MAEDWMIKLTRDEALVLASYLHRWSETDDAAFMDDAERTARDNLLCLLEARMTGQLSPTTTTPQIAAARDRLRPPKG